MTNQSKPTLIQGDLLFLKWIVPDEELNNKFEFTKKFEQKIRTGLSMKQYKYLLFLMINKKRFQLNQMISSLGAKTRLEIYKKDMAEMQLNGCYN